MAAWDKALKGAQSLPCRAIAVDGHVSAEMPAPASAPESALEPVPLRGEIPTDTWLSLAPDSRLVAKDPRTTRETAFVGPARVQPCVAHREESWIASGRFESSIGAGETPGAEEWAVTPLGVARYMAAQLQLDVRGQDATVGATVTLGTGVAFLWLPDDTHEGPAPRGAGDGGPVAATTALDDDGWRRMTGGSLALARTGARAPADAAAFAVDQCLALTKQARALADQLLAGGVTQDAGAAKDQLRIRRIARAACAVAALRVEILPAAKAKATLAGRLVEARGVRGMPSGDPPGGPGTSSAPAAPP
jgi:hypothetical protein